MAILRTNYSFTLSSLLFNLHVLNRLGPNLHFALILLLCDIYSSFLASAVLWYALFVSEEAADFLAVIKGARKFSANG